MRKILMISGMFAVLCFGAATNFSNNWGEYPLFNVGDTRSSGVDMIFSMHQLVTEEMMLDGVEMKSFGVPAVFLQRPGRPNLGGASRYLAIPEGASVQVTILKTRTETYSNVEVAPAPTIPLDNDDSPLRYEKDMSIYGKNAYWPESPVLTSQRMEIRGVDVVLVGVVPFQYNPVTKELIIYKDIQFRVDFIGGNGHFGEDRLRNRYWEPILQGNLLNYSQLPKIDFDSPERLGNRDNVEYIIIVPNDAVFEAWGDTLKRWRILQGISSDVFTLTEIGGSTTTAIENFLNNAYNTWNPAPVGFLILSDYATSGAEVYGVPSPMWNSYCVSDNIYADVNGDNLPDMIHGRICAQTAAHLDTMIHKLLTYEKTPSTSATFYDMPIVAAAWQTERWFQMCGETVRNFFQLGLGKTTNRLYAIYSGTPTVGCQWSTRVGTKPVVRYWHNAGWLPDTLNMHNSTWWSNGNNTLITQGINSGAFIVQHRDHGMETGWGEPAYTNSDIYNLTNLPPNLTFVNSSNCLTGRYNWASECFAERFHRDTHGAVGLNAASQTSYSFVNDTYIWGTYDCMWQQFDPGYPAFNLTGYNNLRPCVAMCYAKIYHHASWMPDSAQAPYELYTDHLFHHHTDVFLTLFSQMPQNLTVSHAATLEPGATSFTVTANDSSVIALTVNYVIIGTAMGTGAPVAITIPPQTQGAVMKVTVTRFNYRRYEADVPVQPVGVQEEAASVRPSSLTIHPTMSQGSVLIELFVGKAQSGRAPELAIFNSSGQRVKVFNHLNNQLVNQITWDGSDDLGRSVPAGVYFVRVETEDAKLTEKAILLR